MVVTIEAFGQDLVKRITGLSQRQLEYWDQIDFISPSVARHDTPGLPRLYSFQDLLELKVAAEMRQRRVLPSEMSVRLRELRGRGVSDPLLTLQIVAEPDEDEGTNLAGAPIGADKRTRRRLPKYRRGRAYWIDPTSHAVMSWQHSDQEAVVFNVKLKDLRSGLEATIEQLTQRPRGKIERVKGVQGNQPVIAGTRVPTRKVARLLRAGWDLDDVLKALPQLTKADVEAAARYEKERIPLKSA